MKRLLTVIPFLFLAVLAPVISFSQTCGSPAHADQLSNNNPRRHQQYLQRQAQLSEWLRKHPNVNTSSSIHTIPVVIHVVYKNAAENIPDSVILDQVDVLNEDFARLNADTVNTPSAFNVAGPTSFRFCIAQRDPDDNPTTGIERRSTFIQEFTDSTNEIYYQASGGMDAWDVDRYFNIWVCAMDTSVTGTAEFPDIAPHSRTYGAVINYLYFGRNGNALAPFNLGRTATHMVAHCFGLHHIWGDDGGNCTSDDGVTDTPLQGDATTGCLTFPAYDACTPSGNGIMFMNYMDNSDDNCRNMFTLQQDGWMDLEMGFDFPTLLNSNGCQAAILTDNDVWMRNIISPLGTSCSLSASPVIQIKNYGTIPITDIDFNYSYDGGSYSVYHWSGSLASLALTFVSLPSVSLTGGSHIFTVYASNPNGSADPVPGNDTLTSMFDLIDHGASLPFTEGFEGGLFPPTGWQLNNPDLDYTWEITNAAFASGLTSVTIDNYDYSAVTAMDELITPAVDLSSVTNPVLTFDVAYTYFYIGGTVPLISTDTLEVLISTDCGQNFNRIYYKGGRDLSTADSTDIAFIPTSSQWRNELVSLSAYAADSQVVFKFRNINGFGNRMYLDNIDLTSLTGIPGIANDTPIGLYPNPAAGIFNLDLSRLPGNVSLSLLDVTGRMVNSRQDIRGGSVFSWNVEGISPGVYFVKVQSGSFSRVMHVVIRK